MKRTLAVVVGLCASTGLYDASANLLVSEDFNYAAGPLAGQNGGTGFAGPWSGAAAVDASGLSVNVGGFTYDGGPGSLRLQAPDNAAAASRPLTAITADHVYVGMLLKVTTQALNDNDFAAGWFNDYNGLGFGLKANQGGGGQYDLFARTRLNGPAVYRENLTIGSTYLIVAEFSKSTPGSTKPYDTASLWVNPTYSSKSTFGAPSTTTTHDQDATTASLGTLGFRTANLDNVNGNKDIVYYDMLRIGENWADVVVPETSTYVMGALLTLPFGITLYRALRRNRMTS